MQHRSRASLLIATAVAAFALSGCTATGGCTGAGGQCRASPEVSLTVPTDASLTYNPAGDYAGLEGILRGERSGSRACLYIESASGLAKGRVNLVFPAGYSSTDQLALFDSTRRLIAKTRNPVVISIAPSLSAATPPGCSTPGVGSARALHVEQRGAE